MVDPIVIADVGFPAAVQCQGCRTAHAPSIVHGLNDPTGTVIVGIVQVIPAIGNAGITVRIQSQAVLGGLNDIYLGVCAVCTPAFSNG